MPTKSAGAKFESASVTKHTGDLQMRKAQISAMVIGLASVMILGAFALAAQQD
jgi:hypothetical protein